MRRIQALTTQQLTDLARLGARVRLGQDPRLVLRRERAALGLLDQVRVRDPLRRGAPGMLQRVSELAVQYQNGDLSSTDKTDIQDGWRTTVPGS